MKLPPGWRATVDPLYDNAKPFEDSCFRSVELAWAHPDDVISGEGTKAKGGRFAAKGTRAVYASLEEETATREVTARKARLGGKAQISLKDYPRLMYIVSVEVKRCVDLRNGGNDAVLKQVLTAVLDPVDLSASQEVGDYLAGKGSDAAIFPSVVCDGANIVVFRDAASGPKISIENRDEILMAIQAMANRTSK